MNAKWFKSLNIINVFDLKLIGVIYRHIFKIKSISMHQLLSMIVMIDFIFMGYAELLATGSKGKVQNESICLHRELNQRLLAFQHGASYNSAMLTVEYHICQILGHWRG